MGNLSNKTPNSLFEDIRKVDEDGNEYLSARELWKVLEYTEYRHFLPVVDQAKIPCDNSGQVVANHLDDLLEMVSLVSGSQ